MRKYVVALAVLLVSAVSFSTPAAAQSKWLRIENHRAAFPIWTVYITPAGAPDWGSDQLGGTTIGAGSSYTWTIPWNGCYVDVKAVTFTGLFAERYRVNICGGFVWTIHD